MSREYFDSLGSEWDRFRETLFPDAVREKALAAARVEGGRTAVDVGAGTGFITLGLLAWGLDVIAVDQSPVMLDALRRKHASDVTLDCQTGDAESLPIADAAADYCFANMLLHHVERPLHAVREMVRVVRPGGRVVVTDLDEHDHEFLKKEHHDRWMGFSRTDVQSWLEQAGLTNVRVESVGEWCCATSCDGSSAMVSIFLAVGDVAAS